MTRKAVVLLSGGQDSTTCLFWSKKNFDEVHCLSVNYGQVHSLELESAKKVADLAGVADRVCVTVPNVLRSTSPLVDRGASLERYASYEQMDKTIGGRVELTFVPMRNALFLTVAANYAISKGIKTVVTGVCQEDNANYPDCRRNYIDAQQLATNLALGISDYVILTPLMDLSKSATVKLGAELPGCYEALAHSHTSYDGKYPPTDMNHSNVLRAKGFLDAGIPDPLVLRAWCEGLMELPKESNYAGTKVPDYLGLAHLTAPKPKVVEPPSARELGITSDKDRSYVWGV